jgi:hypothetical protein
MKYTFINNGFMVTAFVTDMLKIDSGEISVITRGVKQICI